MGVARDGVGDRRDLFWSRPRSTRASHLVEIDLDEAPDRPCGSAGMCCAARPSAVDQAQPID